MKKPAVALVAALAVLGLAGCGSSSSGPVTNQGSNSSSTYPFTMDMGAGFGSVAVSCVNGVLVAESSSGQLSMKVAQC